MESLWRALEPLSPAERAAFLEAGVSSPSQLQATYLWEEYQAIVVAAAQTRFGHLAPLERDAALGRLMFASFEKTFAARALLPLLRVLGPSRAIARIAANFRTANNFTEAEVELVSPTHSVIRLEGAVFPGFFRGVLEAAGPRLGVRQLEVKLMGVSDDKVATFELRWT